MVTSCRKSSNNTGAITLLGNSHVLLGTGADNIATSENWQQVPFISIDSLVLLALAWTGWGGYRCPYMCGKKHPSLSALPDWLSAYEFILLLLPGMWSLDNTLLITYICVSLPSLSFLGPLPIPFFFHPSFLLFHPSPFLTIVPSCQGFVRAKMFSRGGPPVAFAEFKVQTHHKCLSTTSQRQTVCLL